MNINWPLEWAKRYAALGKRVMYVTPDRQVLFSPGEPPKIEGTGGISGEQATGIVYDELQAGKTVDTIR